MSTFKIANTQKFGEDMISKLFTDTLYTDDSFIDVETQKIDSDQGIADSTNTKSKQKFNFTAEFADDHLFSVNDTDLNITLKIDNNGTPITKTAKSNIARTFNLYDYGEIKINGKLAQKIDHIGHYKDIMGLLTHTKENLKTGNYYQHYDEATRATSQATDITYGTDYASATSAYLIPHGESSAIADVDGKYMTFTSDATNMTITTDVANAKTFKMFMRTMPAGSDNDYIKKGNYIGAQRKKHVIDHYAGAEYYTFPIPISWFFPVLESLGKFAYLPIKKIEIMLQRIDDDAKYIVCEADTPKITIIELQLNVISKQMHPSVAKKYRELYRQKPLIIPFINPQYNEVEISSDSALVKTEIENLRYVVNFFTTKDQKDIFRYRLPTAYDHDTIANNTTITQAFKYDGKDLQDNDTETLIDAPNCDARALYNNYKKATWALGNSNKTDLPISYNDIRTDRPIFPVKIRNHKENIQQTNWNDAIAKKLVEKYEFSKNVTADTIMHSIYFKQAYLIFTYTEGDVSIKTINI